MGKHMDFQWVTSCNPDFNTLTEELDQFFRSKLGDEKQSEFDSYNQKDTLTKMMVIYQDNQPVACGALKIHPDQSAELKRIYVRRDFRHNGIARKMIGALEEKAVHLGCTRMLLETNPAFSDAVALYARLGYEKTENFGPYVGICTLCMSKPLSL